MKDIIGVQFAPWDKIYDFDPKDLELKVGDYVVTKTNIGMEIGRVVENKKIDEKELETAEAKDEDSKLKAVLRKADQGDFRKLKQKQERKEEMMDACRELIKKHKLPMKLVDARFSFDGGRIVFAFIAKERIDFRKLVEELTRQFQKSIRMQQIGVREEAKLCGGIGVCGKGLCCAKFLKNLGNVTLDLIHDQQVAHRGVDRLSGICGRLLCCLSYEEEFYKNLITKMPPLGSVIKTDKGKGVVKSWHVLKKTVGVEIEDGVIIEVPVKK